MNLTTMAGTSLPTDSRLGFCSTVRSRNLRVIRYYVDRFRLARTLTPVTAVAGTKGDGSP